MGSPDYNESQTTIKPAPIEFRQLEPTDKFCLSDLRHSPAKAMCAIAEQFTKSLEPLKVEVKYINIVDMDTTSPNYNPDGQIGRFHLIQHR